MKQIQTEHFKLQIAIQEPFSNTLKINVSVKVMSSNLKWLSLPILYIYYGNL